MDIETVRVLLGKLEQGLAECRDAEARAMEARLRQEGAVLALRQVVQEAEQTQAAAAIAVPLVEEGEDGGNH